MILNRFSLLLLGLISSNLSFAEEKIPNEIEFNLSCYQSDSSLKIEYTDEDPTTPILKSFDSWINELEKSKEYEWFECCQKVSSGIEVQLQWWNGQKKISDENYENTLAQLRSKVSKYGAESYSSGKIPYFSDEKSISEKRTQELLSRIKFYSCNPEFSPTNLSTDILSNDFLVYHLSQLMLDIKNKHTSDYHKKCAKGLVLLYAGEVLKISLTDEQCENNKDACDKRKEEIEKILTQVSLISEVGDEFSKALDEYNSCGKRIGLLNEQLKDLELGLKDISSCISLKEDESIQVLGNKGSGIEGNYTLKRLPDKKDEGTRYEIELPIKFNDQRESGNVQEFIEKTQKCLSENEKYFNGPNGESLKITLKTEFNEEDYNKVNIAAESMRDNSHNWSPDIDCETIIHELMHLLGLVDEYQETARGVILKNDGSVEVVEEDAEIPSKDCRAIGPDDSIMSHHWKALDSVKGETTITSCLCDRFSSKMWDDLYSSRQNSNDEQINPYFGGQNITEGSNITSNGELTNPYFGGQNITEGSNNTSNGELTNPYFGGQNIPPDQNKCDDVLENISFGAEKCPDGSQEISRILSEEDIEDNDFIQNLINNKKLDSKSETLIKIEVKKKKESLLYPAHFRYLTEPGCSTSNKTYNICANLSYKTSLGNYGYDRCLAGVPEICKKGGESWLK